MRDCSVLLFCIMYFDFADVRLRCISISASRLYVVSGQDGTPELTTTPVHALILCGLFSCPGQLNR